MPKVSVVIPVYNRGDLAREAINSVLAQTYRDFEIIAVDDGSTDNSLAVLNSYGAEIKIVSQANRGQGAARNVGIENTAGKFVAFLDSDDIWEPLKLQKQLNLLETTHRSWIYSDAYKFVNHRENVLQNLGHKSLQIGGNIAAHLLIRDFIVTSTVVVRREVLYEVGLFTNTPKAQDWDLWLRIAARYPIAYVSEALVGYRLHSAMISSAQKPLDALEYHLQAINNAINFAPEVYQPIQKQAIAFQYMKAGNSLAAIGELSQARKMFLLALKYHPLNYSALLRWVATFLGAEFIMRRIASNRARSLPSREEE